MILLIFVLRHAGSCGILGDESLRPSIFCHQLNKYSAYLDINHCHHHLSHEKYFHYTKKHFYLWVFSWGVQVLSYWSIDTTIVSLFFKKKKKIKKKKKKMRKKEKEKKKKRRHTWSINKALVSYTSFMYLRMVIWLSKCYFDSSWLLLLWVGFGLNFMHLIHIPHISKRAICLYLAIRLYYHWV